MKKVLKNKRKSLKLTTLAFTLIELLGVIVLLAVIALIATPIVLNMIREAQASADMSSAHLIESNGHNYYAASLFDENKKENTSILDVNLHTGKTHQISAHLAHIGHPIIGDGKYGNNQINKKFGCKTQQLCSYSLTFRFTTPSGILDYLKNKTIKL